jgi:hypothetical protein
VVAVRHLVVLQLRVVVAAAVLDQIAAQVLQVLQIQEVVVVVALAPRADWVVLE